MIMSSSILVGPIIKVVSLLCKRRQDNKGGAVKKTSSQALLYKRRQDNKGGVVKKNVQDRLFYTIEDKTKQENKDKKTRKKTRGID